MKLSSEKFKHSSETVIFKIRALAKITDFTNSAQAVLDRVPPTGLILLRQEKVL